MYLHLQISAIPLPEKHETVPTYLSLCRMHFFLTSFPPNAFLMRVAKNIPSTMTTCQGRLLSSICL